MSQTKERPILFSGPMVRAILEGRKTVTRRAMKPQPVLNGSFWELGGAGWSDRIPSITPVAGHSLAARSPYGQPGDRLWVRETWYCDDFRVQRGPYLKPADLDLDEAREYGALVYAADGLTPYEAEQPVWKPSIHMPRWVCRILLEITAVRVERLQDISDEQAQAEGCFFTDYGLQCFHGGTGWKDVGDCPAQAGHQRRNGWMWDATTSHEQCLGTPRWAFGNLWNSVNGPDAWDANPWVWVVEFKRVMP